MTACGARHRSVAWLLVLIAEEVLSYHPLVYWEPMGVGGWHSYGSSLPPVPTSCRGMAEHFGCCDWQFAMRSLGVTML